MKFVLIYNFLLYIFHTFYDAYLDIFMLNNYFKNYVKSKGKEKNGVSIIKKIIVYHLYFRKQCSIINSY